jgi:hypothetical protein
MADAALFIGFGRPARAREEQAIQQFGKALSLYGELRDAGEIESFEPVLLEPHGGDLQGFFLIRGTREQLVRLRADERFRSLVARAGLVVDAIGVVDAHIGNGLAGEMSLYTEQVQAQLSS